MALDNAFGMQNLVEIIPFLFSKNMNTSTPRSLILSKA